MFDHHPLPGDYRIGSLRLETQLLPHFVPTVGVRLSGLGITISYATDTGPDEALAGLGRDADLFIVDATDRPGEAARAERHLLSAAEAGEWAQRAGARRLLLTHLWPGTDPARSVERARHAFTGPIEVARQGTTIPFPT